MMTREQMMEQLMAAFQPEAQALVRQKILSRDECSALVSAFARIAADLALRGLEAQSLIIPRPDLESTDGGQVDWPPALEEKL